MLTDNDGVFKSELDDEFDNDVDAECSDAEDDDDEEEVKLKYFFGFVVACICPPKRCFCKPFEGPNK